MIMIHKLKKFTFQIILGANIATILLMLLIGYSGHINPAHYPIASVIGLTFPVVLLINVAFLIFWIIAKFRYCIVPVTGFLLCYGPVRTYCPFNIPETPPANALKVLSFNIESFGYENLDAPEDNPTVQYLLNSKADIICLQEMSIPTMPKEQIDRVLKQKYPYISHKAKTAGTENLALYSKLPLLMEEVIDYQTIGNLSVAYYLKWNDHTLLLVNNHFESNQLDPEERNNFNSFVKGEMERENMKKESTRLISKLTQAAKTRAPQVDAVARYISHNREGKSVIVCGDFNESPISYSNVRFKGILTDCYVASGNGPGISYNKDHFYVRIDNIFCSENLKPYQCTVDNKVHLSDHFPIICRLEMREKP